MLVLLHGFAGTGHAWDDVAAGLGGTPYLAPTLRTELPVLPAEPVALAGYSMGGRIALHLALASPARVERLVLVSATPGIEDERERAARRAADEGLARRIEQGAITEFADEWMAQPLFAGTSPKVAAHWLQDILRNEPSHLAAQLRTFGQGVMEPVWDRLGELTMPADVVVGERDAKYRAIAERLVAALPQARLHVIDGAGHGLPRDAPLPLAQLLRGSADPGTQGAGR